MARVKRHGWTITVEGETAVGRKPGRPAITVVGEAGIAPAILVERVLKDGLRLDAEAGDDGAERRQKEHTADTKARLAADAARAAVLAGEGD